MSQNLNSTTEQAYLSLVHSYINSTRDILNGYMTFETGLTRAINSEIVRNFTRTSFAVPATTIETTTTTTTTQSESASVELESEPPVIETPANLFRRETAQIPDAPIRPAFRFRSAVPSTSSVPSSPFQMPTPVRLTSRLDTPPEERESQRRALPLPRRAGGVSQPQPEQIREGGMPFASTFVRYGLPVPIGPARRVPVTNATPSENIPPPISTPTTTSNTSNGNGNANLRSVLEMPIISPQHSPSPPPTDQIWQRRQQRRQQQYSLSPILPVEPTPLPPAPAPLVTATRLMLDLLDTPRLNDSLVYYTQVIDREIARSREGRGLSYDVIQQQTKIVPYCTITRPLNDICPISQLQFDLIDSVMQINTCKHNFNPYSLLRWFDSNSTCPMCRQQIRVTIEDNDDDNDEQTIYMYNNGLPYRSESAEHRENNYNDDDSDFSSVG